MKRISTLLALVAVGVAAIVLGTSQLMASDQSQLTKLVPVEPDATNAAFTRLNSYEEVPAISTNGIGNFDLFIAPNDAQVDWRLNYSGTQGVVSQAHIHFAQRGVNGGIVVFLCTNLGNGPAGTQLCPTSGNISGSFTSAGVGAGANAQGIASGEMAEVLRAIRAGITYANIHTDLFPGGEIRGQLSFAGGLSDGPRAPSSPAVIPGPSGGPSGPAGSDGTRGPGG